MKNLLTILRSKMFPRMKKCKNWTTFRVPNGQKTMIASNFTQEELSDLVIPKATVNFYAPDTNISMFPIDTL